eukprot:11709310-Alexandrium_andersonii.AAC.1
MGPPPGLEAPEGGAVALALPAWWREGASRLEKLARCFVAWELAAAGRSGVAPPRTEPHRGPPGAHAALRQRADSGTEPRRDPHCPDAALCAHADPGAEP